MAEEKNYLERLRTYRTYIESEIERYRKSSQSNLPLDFLFGANNKKDVLEDILFKLDRDFPELKSKNSK